MSLNFKEIFEAWILSANPNENQKKLSTLRFEVCQNCPFMNDILGVQICGKCGCPISKKIFTNKYDACPAHKWIEIEKQFFGHIELEEKKEKKII